MMLSAFANDQTHTFVKNKVCQECHPIIYDEYTKSQHNNSTIYKDPIHAAVWKKHPKNLKKKQYGCGKCHTPAADNLNDMITKGAQALPDAANATQNEGISCAYCHRIKSIEKHKRTNTNIIDPKEKRYYGTLRQHMTSPFHEIATEGNDHMRNGNVCIGCHSHKMNKHGLNVCSTNIANEMDGSNCVSCHMPQSGGSVSALNKTETHAFHGFAGTHSHASMLSKYIDLSMVRNIETFTLNVDNRTSHALLLHPLRLAKLKVTVIRDGKRIDLEDKVFVRVIGKNGKPAMPWVADKEIKNSMLKANEKRAVKYSFSLQKGDTVEAVLGYYLVNPKVLPKLKLQNNKEASEFKILKKESFLVR